MDIIIVVVIVAFIVISIVVVAVVFRSLSLGVNLKFKTGSAAYAHNLMGFLVKSFKWMTGLPSQLASALRLEVGWG